MRFEKCNRSALRNCLILRPAYTFYMYLCISFLGCSQKRQDHFVRLKVMCDTERNTWACCTYMINTSTPLVNRCASSSAVSAGLPCEKMVVRILLTTAEHLFSLFFIFIVFCLYIECFRTISRNNVREKQRRLSLNRIAKEESVFSLQWKKIVVILTSQKIPNLVLSKRL